MNLIENTNQHSENMVAAKVIAMTQKLITVMTQDGQYLTVPITIQERRDNLFIASIKDIWHAGIWIPVNRKFHGLLEYDWITNPTLG
ncbi:hypothetical protein LOOC260_119810 [Paucilactobacillus hokkaidonensis JCM 18461]|uniref:Uncharacterized protein n=2 Tax=Paucilactobacillus hokkaidonensis TaxID=1193095 RepID=A0A0A1GW45_9LACO|nr:hypothetical protein [Paucilactobacillus hokkaidonensis]KRO11150.1 hypothetical protein IV59_GL000902 [Paucilactobacillus hokkaidonensis]BAP86487.1 hypothetical protein LOOC260_119810 [Paucilactobacillus hokkaidonensis JCM 18461]